MSGHSPKLRLLCLDHIDGRTTAGQRARALLANLYAHLGGEQCISVAEEQLVSRAAVLGVMCADFEATWLRGGELNLDHYLAASNNLRRLLQVIGLSPRQVDVTPNLHDYLRQKEAANGD